MSWKKASSVRPCGKDEQSGSVVAAVSFNNLSRVASIRTEVGWWVLSLNPV